MLFFKYNNTYISDWMKFHFIDLEASQFYLRNLSTPKTICNTWPVQFSFVYFIE